MSKPLIDVIHSNNEWGDMDVLHIELQVVSISADNGGVEVLEIDWNNFNKEKIVNDLRYLFCNLMGQRIYDVAVTTHTVTHDGRKMQ